MNWINGIIVAGYGVAGGLQEKCAYPGGTIRMQRPFFMEKGMDLSPYFPGTLNIDVAPVDPNPVSGRVVFDDLIQWFPGIEERFVLSQIEIEAKGHVFAGLWYYPHPETKQEHFQPASVIELLLPWIDGLATGETVAVRL
jgi:hypothetical protein